MSPAKGMPAEKRQRSKYGILRGKVVDWIEHDEQDGLVTLTIGFADGTTFDVTCGTRIIHAYHADMSSGDEVRIKEFRKFKR